MEPDNFIFELDSGKTITLSHQETKRCRSAMQGYLNRYGKQKPEPRPGRCRRHCSVNLPHPIWGNYCPECVTHIDRVAKYLASKKIILFRGVRLGWGIAKKIDDQWYRYGQYKPWLIAPSGDKYQDPSAVFENYKGCAESTDMKEWELIEPRYLDQSVHWRSQVAYGRGVVAGCTV